jgi:hypothetical protein
MMSWLCSLFSPARRTTGGPPCRLQVEQLEGRVVPAGVIAVGTGAGVPGRVALFHDSNNDGVPDGSAYDTFSVFGPRFTGGVRVAVGNFVGDSNLELAVAAGPGGGSVLLFHLDATDTPTGTPERFQPFGSGFTHGLNIARAHTGGAAHDSLVVGADAGELPRVAVYSDDTTTGGATPNDGLFANSRVDTFLAFAPTFRGGVRVAAGRNLTAGAVSDSVALATGPGITARVRILKDTNNDFRLSDSLTAAETLFPVGSWGGGIFVAVGDVGSPSANAELIVSRGAGSPPRVFIFADANNNGLYGDDHGPASSFLAFGSGYRGGVRLAASRLSPAAVNLQGELIVAPGPGGPLRVGVYKAASNGEIGPTDTPLAQFFPFGSSFTAGYFVAFGGNGS